METADVGTIAGTGVPVNVTGLVRAFHSGGGRLTAVAGVDLAVPAGAVVTVTGPSGSGKSTLLHMIGAIERADTGSIRVDGVEIRPAPGRRADR